MAQNELPFLALDSRATRVFRDFVRNRGGIGQGDHVLILCDTETSPGIIYGLATAIAGAGGIYTILIQPGGGFDPTDPHAITKPAQGAVSSADVIIAATASNSAGLYGGRKLSGKKRFLSLSERRFEDVLLDTADYNELEKNAQRVASILEKGTEVHITSENGSDFTAVVSQQSVALHKSLGVFYHAGFTRGGGDMGAAPDGEIHFGPVLGSVKGIIVVDGPIAHVVNKPNTPVKLTVSGGRILEIQGAKEARDLEAVINSHKNANYVSEVGLGLNPNCPLDAEVLHVAKNALGNAHVAYGEYMLRRAGEHTEIEDMGPHSDMVIRNVRYEVDGKVIVENAKLKV